MSTDIPQGDVIDVDLDPAAMLQAYASHRRRLSEEAGALDAAMLAAPSRCRGWSVADVLRHLCDVDSWLERIWAGEAPPFDQFDPRVTPNEFVEAGRSTPDTEVRDRYQASTTTMLAGIDPSDCERWGVISISPLGFVPWWQSALHVLWDSWVHERDALLPIGTTVPVEADEVAPVLLYSLALAGTFCRGAVDVELVGARLVRGDGPIRVAPRSTGVRCDGDAAAVIDALTGRGSLEEALPEADTALVAQVGGLARYLPA